MALSTRSKNDEAQEAREAHPRMILGHLGELLAADRLRREGYVILERNYRCPSGEIDLIAREENVLVFVEVRTRTSEGFGTPLETIDFGKQRRIREVARHYLRERRPCFQDVRFDVVGVLLKEGEEARVEIVPHAFYQGQLR
mgnify:CR=1 FL=1